MRTWLGLCTGDRKTIKVLTQQLPLKSPAISSPYCFWYCQNSSLPSISLQHSLQVSRPGQLHLTLHASSQAAKRGTLWPASAVRGETSPASNISWGIQELGRQNCQIFTSGTSPKFRVPSSQRGINKEEFSVSQWARRLVWMVYTLYFLRALHFPNLGSKIISFEVVCPGKLTWRSLSTCRDGPCCYDVLWSREGNKSWRSYMPIKWWSPLHK